MGYEYIYFTMKDSVELDSMKIKDAYYIYTDLNKVFHYSWSFNENIQRMENRTGFFTQRMVILLVSLI